jgi:hypothetical protein
MITPELCGRLFAWPQSFNLFPNPSLLTTQITEAVSSFFSQLRIRFGTSQIAPKPMNIKTVSMFSCVCLLAILLIGMLRPASAKNDVRIHPPVTPEHSQTPISS